MFLIGGSPGNNKPAASERKSPMWSKKQLWKEHWEQEQTNTHNFANNVRGIIVKDTTEQKRKQNHWKVKMKRGFLRQHLGSRNPFGIPLFNDHG